MSKHRRASHFGEAPTRGFLYREVHEFFGTSTHICNALVWGYKRLPASLYLRTGLCRYRTGTPRSDPQERKYEPSPYQPGLQPS